jgi:hypothetical protein
MTGHDYNHPKPRLEARLKWAHGPERARAILEGTDAAANADLAAWKNLGRPVTKAGSK